MADFSSSIRIEDEFSSPLIDYTKEIVNAANTTKMFKDSAVDSFKSVQSEQGEAIEGAIEATMTLIPAFGDLKNSAFEVGSALADMVTDLSIESIKNFTVAIINLGVAMWDTVKSAAKLAWNVGKFIFLWKNGISFMGLRLSSALMNAMGNAYKKAFNYVNKVVGENIDALALQDKMAAAWGDEGIGANNKMYKLANELGENAGELMQRAGKAAANGLGTKDFEDIYRFADRISKLNPGDTAGELADSIIDNFKNGQNADVISNMLGGGEKMTRQLKRMGYERLLHKGDLQGALKIAKEVAVQAGYTDEKFEKASNSMSNNFKYINNVISNIKKHLAEIYARRFEPIVKKLAEIMKSEDFQLFVSIVEKVIDKVGEFVSGVIETLMDNWQIFAVAIYTMIVAKILIASKLIAVFWKFRGVIFTVLKGVLHLIWGFKGLIASMFKLGDAGTKANKSLMMSGAKFLAIAAAVYMVYKLFSWIGDEISSATGKTVSWKGVLAAFYVAAKNGFQNLFTWIHRQFAMTKNNELAKKVNEQNEVYMKAHEKAKKRYAEISAKIDDRWYDKINRYAEYHMQKGTPDEEINRVTEEMNQKRIAELNQAHKDAFRASDAEAKKLNDLFRDYKEFRLEEWPEYVEADKGMKEAIESEGQSVIDELKKDFKTLFGIVDEVQGEVKTNTDTFKKYIEQEEELKWLKAFSDRQIMSKYGSYTGDSYTRNITYNGMPNPIIAAHARNAVSTRPSRTSSLK